MTKPALASVLHNLHRLAETSGDRQPTDQQLLERFVSSQDEAAFALLVRRHGRLVVSACRRVLGDGAEVEDAFQATFLVLLRRASSVRWRASIGCWLFSVAHRVAVQARANAARRKRCEAEASRQRKRPEEVSAELSWREAVGLLHEELDRLPDAYRLPLLLCYFDGKTRDEAAQALGCSPGSVKGRLERGRETLRKRLLRRGLTLSGALLAALVDATAATSTPPPSLIQSTLNAARTGHYPRSVIRLIQAAGPRLFTAKIRIAFGVLLRVSLLALGGSRASTRGCADPATEPPAERPQPNHAAPKPAEEKKNAITIRGRVLGPDDKPVAGAKVYYHFLTREEEPLPVRATTDAQGRFAFTLTPKDVPLTADAIHSDPRKTGHVIVKADGFTFAWHGTAKQQTDLTFHVAPDKNPVVGRIIDLEGKPLASLRVTAWSVAAPEKGDLTPFVQALQSREAF